MTEGELTDCKRDLVSAHKKWKNAVSTGDAQLAAALDAQARQLRRRIVAASQLSGPKRPAQ